MVSVKVCGADFDALVFQVICSHHPRVERLGMMSYCQHDKDAVRNAWEITACAGTIRRRLGASTVAATATQARNHWLISRALQRYALIQVPVESNLRWQVTEAG